MYVFYGSLLEIIYSLAMKSILKDWALTLYFISLRINDRKEIDF